MPRMGPMRGIAPPVMQPLGTTRTAIGSVARSRARTRARWNKGLTIFFFLAPPFVLYVYLVIIPVVQAAYYSLYKWNGLGPLTDFVGLDNYVQLVNEPVFRSAFTHNWLIAFLSVLLQLPLALALALLLGRDLRGRGFFRVVLFLPYVLSEVITGVIWTFLYRVNGGLVNTILEAIIPGFEPVSWLGNPDTVMYAIFVTLTWKYFGIYLILFIAGLQNIPAELEEAACIDGATSLQVIRHVILPLLGSTIRLTIYLSIVGSLQVFDLVWVMTGGGPVNASETMATYLYRFGFQRFQLGYGSSVAVVLFIVAFGFSLLYQRYVMRRELA
jgi:raffinose/stachyose/melibiose transport system permease protein